MAGHVPFPYDFFHPWASVVLELDGQRLPLWWANDVGVQQVAAVHGYDSGNLAMVQEVQIDWQGAYYEMTVILTPTYEEAIKLIDSDLIQQGFTTLDVVIGYRSGKGESQGDGFGTQSFSGVVRGVDFSVGTEISLTLKATPGAVIAASEQQGTRVFNNQTRLEIIEELWRRYAKDRGEKGSFYLNYEFIKPETRARKLLDQKVKVFQAGESDMAAVHKIVLQCNCVALVDGREMTIIPMEVAFGQNSSSRFELFSPQRIGGGTGVYPILAVSTSSKELFARGLRGRLGVGTNQETRAGEKIKVGAPGDTDTDGPTPPVLGPAASPGGKVASGPSGASAVPDAEEDGNGRSVSFVKDPKSSDGKASTTNRAFSEYLNQGIKLEVESVCIPYLFPYTVASVAGIGKKLSGNYWIEKLTHIVNVDGGLTRWEGVNQGRYSDPSSSTLTRGTNKSKESPKTDDGTTESSAKSEGSASEIDLQAYLRENFG